MKKNLNKLATLALSGMMVMSMAMPAFAAPVKVTELTKRLHTDGNTYAPDTTFTFTVKKIEGAKFRIGTTDYDNHAAPDNAVTVNPIVFNKGMGLGTQDADGSSFGKGAHFDKTADVNVDITKLNDGYGNYFFKLTEEDGGYEGIRYSASAFIIVVNKYKDEHDQDKVAVTIQREDKLTDKTTKINTINNNYGKHFPPDTPEFPDPQPTPGPNPKPNPKNDTTHDVVITKNIGGANGNKSDKFKFQVLVNAQNNKNEAYKVQKVELDSTGKPVDKGFFTGTNAFDHVDNNVKSPEFEVTQGTGIHIYGLTKNDKVTIIEGENSYVMDVNDQPQANNDTYVKDLAMVQNEKFQAKFYTLQDDAQVVVNNKQGQITPTGIVMNVAPYVLMLAVAGGMGVVFMNRKKEEE